ncbi:MAG: AcrR family transcriptional regulator [Myxococcota bacterium]|jgi:AcrR family transcriptional regulator
MARPRSIDDSVILAAAREVFLERGFAGTTAEVARRAGVSEGSIFNRFGNKQGLFRAAVQPKIEDATWIENLENRVGVGEVTEHLTEIGLGGISFFQEKIPMIMMAWSNADNLGGCPPMPGRVPLEVLGRLAKYFEAEMRLGRMRRVDAEIVARTFLAAIHNYAFLEVLFKQQGQLPLPAGMYIRGMIDALWNGIAPTPGDSAPEAAKSEV